MRVKNPQRAVNRSDVRTASCPFSRTVFGNLPFPHRKNEPKSLYQSPSGAEGPVRTHACNARRSFARKSAAQSTRCSKWGQTPRGRSENCIFGNRILPEYGVDQIPPGLVLPLRFCLPNEITISGLELLCRLLLARTPRSARTTRARLTVMCRFATRRTSAARLAGIVTLCRTDLMDLALLLVAILAEYQYCTTVVRWMKLPLCLEFWHLP